MKLPDLMPVLTEMRTEQKRFFAGDKTRTQVARCQALEKKMDTLIAEYERQARVMSEQKTLF